MAQFDILQNIVKRTKAETPYLLDLQSDVMSVLSIRLVAPVRKMSLHSASMIKRIHVPVIIDGEKYIAFISEMAAVPQSVLGNQYSHVKESRTEIIAAIDLMVTGF